VAIVVMILGGSLIAGNFWLKKQKNIYELKYFILMTNFLFV
jgi:uncharacterized membrane-anchored protein